MQVPCVFFAVFFFLVPYETILLANMSKFRSPPQHPASAAVNWQLYKNVFFLFSPFFYNAEGAVAGEGGWSHVGLFISSKMIRLTCKSPSCGLLVSIAHKRQQFPVPATASGSFSPTALHRFYAAMAAFFLFLFVPLFAAFCFFVYAPRLSTICCAFYWDNEGVPG